MPPGEDTADRAVRPLFTRSKKKRPNLEKCTPQREGKRPTDQKKMLVVRRLPRERTEPIKLYITRFDT